MLEGTTVFIGNHKGVDISIRHARRNDVEKIMSFMNSISVEQTYITFQGEQISLEEESRYMEDFIHKAENHRAAKLLVFHEDILIGVADVTMKERVENHVGIFGIILAKDWRRKGIGRFLMEKTLEQARINIPSLNIVTLGVFANNPVAKMMYEKLGFKEYGLLPKSIAHKGQLIDHIYMYKFITKS